MGNALEELRQYRELSRRRDRLIRRAARDGRSQRQIARAVGMHIDSVKRILRMHRASP
jgi:hypothetical protein